MPVNTELKRLVKVEKLTGRTGRPVKRQYILHAPEGRYFQSYAALVAFQSHCKTVTLLDPDYWQYSRTTMKYLSNFIGEPMHTIKEKVQSGIYKLVRNIIGR